MKLTFAFFRQSFHNTAVYKFEFWLQLFNTFLLMYAVHWVWKVLYGQNPDAFGVNLQQMISYGILGIAFELIFYHTDGPNTYISKSVKSGAITNELIKPLDFHLHMFSRNLGEICFKFLILVIPSIIIAYIFLDLIPIENFLTLIYFLTSFLLGYLVLFSLNFLIGLIAIITLDIDGIEWGYYALLRFFGGQMIPLWLFPSFLEGISNILPFKAIYYIPMSIYIGKFNSNEIIEALLFQGLWLLILVIFGRLLWRLVYSRVTVQGG